MTLDLPPALIAALSTILFCSLSSSGPIDPTAAEIPAPRERVHPQDPVRAANASKAQREDLILPTSQFSMLDDAPPAVRPIFDIVQDGRVLCEKKTWYDPLENPDDYAGMLDLLVYIKKQPQVKKQEERIGARKWLVVNSPILIRADKHTEWHYVGKFMEQCSKPEAAFWKIELGMSEEGEGGKVLPTKVPAYLPRDTGVDAEPHEQLSVRIRCDHWGTEVPRNREGEATSEKEGVVRQRAFDLDGHKIHWDVGPKRISSEEELRKEVRRVFTDRSTWVPDKDTGGLLKPMPVVIEPHPGATYGDMVKTLDAITLAANQAVPNGTLEINFGGGRGARKR